MDKALIIDVETTGLNPEVDEIIEIGIIEFAQEGRDAAQITGAYSALQEPAGALSPEIEEITGLSTRILKGQSIDWGVVRQLMTSASLVIAHNAPFDRGFVMRRPELQGITIHWACSLRHVDWTKHGFRNHSLTYLAADHGFLNPFAHRAIFDAATTFRLVAPYLSELIERSYEREVLVEAVGAPYEQRLKLKSRGYAWNAEKRVWCRVIAESTLVTERCFLEGEIYCGTSHHTEVLVTSSEC